MKTVVYVGYKPWLTERFYEIEMQIKAGDISNRGDFIKDFDTNIKHLFFPPVREKIQGITADEWHLDPSVTDQDVITEVAIRQAMGRTGQVIVNNQPDFSKVIKNYDSVSFTLPEGYEIDWNVLGKQHLTTEESKECHCSSKALASVGHEPGCNWRKK